MAATLNAVYQEALSLPDSTRLELAERLIASIPINAELEAAQLQEVRRRMKEAQTGQVKTIPGEEVFREVEESLANRRRS